MTSAPKRYPTYPRPVTHFIVKEHPPVYRDWRVIYCLVIPASAPAPCPKCNDTGYIPTTYAGGHVTSYTCDCPAGDRAFDFEMEAWDEMQRDYDDAKSEQWTASWHI